MDKKIIDGLLKNQAQGPGRKFWSQKEIADLTELKKAGVTYFTIKNNSEIIKKYFPARTNCAIKCAYQNIRIDNG